MGELAIAGRKFVLLFKGENCAACKVLDLQLREASAQGINWEGGIDLLIHDAGDPKQMQAFAENQVRSIPCLIIKDDDYKEVRRHQGAFSSVKALIEFIQGG